MTEPREGRDPRDQRRLAPVVPQMGPWPRAVVALFEVAADETPRDGLTYGEWVQAVTDRFARMGQALVDV